MALAWLPKATVQAAIGSTALDYAKKINASPEEIDLAQQVEFDPCQLNFLLLRLLAKYFHFILYILFPFESTISIFLLSPNERFFR